MNENPNEHGQGPASFPALPVKKVQVLAEAAEDPRSAPFVPGKVSEQRQLYRDKTTFRVFSLIVEVALIALLMFYAMTNDTKEFATVVMGPLLTIVAGAAGFYFGRRED